MGGFDFGTAAAGAADDGRGAAGFGGVAFAGIAFGDGALDGVPLGGVFDDGALDGAALFDIAFGGIACVAPGDGARSIDVDCVVAIGRAGAGSVAALRAGEGVAG